jgi:hypothetical protein
MSTFVKPNDVGFRTTARSSAFNNLSDAVEDAFALLPDEQDITAAVAIVLDAEEAYAISLSATSTTAITMATGQKTLTVQTGKSFVPGMDLVIAYTTTPTTRMLATVVSYSGATLVVDVYGVIGSGSYAAWTISMTTAVDPAQFVTPDGVQTLTNKTLQAPVLTGTTQAPTPTLGDNTTKIATTAFVKAEYAPLASPTFTGTASAPTPSVGDNTTKIATTAFVRAEYAPLASPTFTGAPLSTTPAAADSSTKIATTAFVAGEVRTAPFVAYGAITAGDVVSLRSDGKIEVITTSTTPGATGAEETLITSALTVTAVARMDENRFVFACYDGSLYAGTVDPADNTITIGAGALISSVSQLSLAWFPTQSKFIVTYASDKYRVCTVAVNTITLGAERTLPVAGMEIRSAYCTHQDKYVVLIERNTTYDGLCYSASLYSDTLTFGSGAGVFNYSSYSVLANMVEIKGTPYLYTAVLNTITESSITVRIIEINGTVVTSRGSAAISPAVSASAPAIGYDQAKARAVVFWTVSNASKYSIINRSGSTPTAGTVRNFSADIATVNGGLSGAIFDTTINRLVVAGTQYSPYSGYLCAVTASITAADSMEWGEATYLNSATTVTPGFCDVGTRLAFIYQDAGNSNQVTSRVWDSDGVNTTADDWIGIAAESISDAATGRVFIKGGIATNLTGLTTGYDYYVDDSGDLQQTGSRQVGVALSATSLFLTGNM